MAGIDIVGYVSDLTDPKYKGHPHRKLWKDERDEMAVHVLGEFPDTLFSLKRPNEDVIWSQWKRDNFSPITKGPINTAIINERRVFTKSNYVVTFDENDKDTPAYTSLEIFDRKKLEEWVYDMPFLMSKYDPNAVIVPKPYRRDPTLTGIDRKVDVMFMLIESSQIIDKNENFISWLSNETVPYTADGRQYDDGKVYWVIDSRAFYKLIQTGKEEYSFSPGAGSETEGYTGKEYYVHTFNEPLYCTLPGHAKKIGDYTVNTSHMGPYAPWANDALLAYHDFKVSEVLYAHPISIEKERNCDYEGAWGGKCNGGYIMGSDGKMGTCPACHGSGRKPAMQPGDKIIRSVPVVPADPDLLSINIPEIEHIRPPIEGLDAMWNRVIERLELAKEAINRKRVQEEQSGIAKEMDRQDEYSMIQYIAGQWQGSGVLERVYNMVVVLRNPTDWKTKIVSVTTATDFQLKTGAEVLDKLKAAKDAGAPISIQIALVTELSRLEFANNPIEKLKIEIALTLDVLHLHSIEIQNLMLSNDSAELKELVLSLHINQIVDKKLMADSGAAKWSMMQWVVYVDSEITKMMDERPKPVDITEPIFKPQPQGAA